MIYLNEVCGWACTLVWTNLTENTWLRRSVIFSPVKRIKITKGKWVVVDNEDYESLVKFSWAFHHMGYAVRGKPQVSMHRVIMNAKPGQLVDHKNRNKLDNRKQNLRFCTPRENQYNSTPRRKILKGIYWRESRKAWIVRVKKDGKRVFVGYFKSLSKAKVACKEAVKEFHGEFARLYA